MSDAMSHAILPGAAAGFLVAGLSFGDDPRRPRSRPRRGPARRCGDPHDGASGRCELAAFYLISLAGGVLLVSLRGSQIDLMHFLFGSVLALDDRRFTSSAASPP